MINYLLFFVVLILSINSILNKSITNSFDPFTIQLYSSLISLILIPVWYFLSKKVSPADLLTKDGLFIGISTILNSIGFYLILLVLRFKSPSYVSAYLAIYPAIVLLISCLMGMEKLSIVKIISILLIILGVWLLNYE